MTDSEAVRILIADDHQVVREGLVAIIGRQPDMDIVAEAGDGAAALELYRTVRPDLSLLDLRMPGMDGLEVLDAIRGEDPAAAVIVLTTFDDEEDIYRSLRGGARGYILKDALKDELLTCIREVRAGRSYIPPLIASKLAQRMSGAELTARERDVLELMAPGKSNRQIAADLFITEGTVKVHVNNILGKLGTRGRTEAVAFAIKHGLVRLG